MEKKYIIIGIISIILVASIISIVGFFIIYADISQEEDVIKPSDNDELDYRQFNIGNYNFSSISDDIVNNPYFILKIGYRLVLEGEDEEGADIQLNITVLNQIEMVGGIETRVVEERETEDGELIEVSYNYFAICNETKDIIYFGEESNEYEDGKIVSNEGSWRADEDDNKPGIIMPGTIENGDMYYQEYAPEEALDKGEIIRKNAEFETPAGEFDNCLIVKETNDLEPLVVEYKYHAPGIGLIGDETLVLISYGYV